MVRAKRIDLARLSIAALIEAFVDVMTAALAGRHAIRIENWAAWTVMAATLTELWSRLLLPPDAPEARAAAAQAEALRRQLLERARMREAAGWLERRPQLGHAVFARGMSAATPSGRASDMTELLRGCLVALRVPETHAAALRPAPPRLWQVTDAIARIQRLLDVLPDASPLSEFLPAPGGGEPPARCAAGPRSPARWWPGWNWPGPGHWRWIRMPRGPPSGWAAATTIVMLPRPSPDRRLTMARRAPIVRRARRRPGSSACKAGTIG